MKNCQNGSDVSQCGCCVEDNIEEVAKAIKLSNAIPREHLGGQSPYEVLFGQSPNLGIIPNSQYQEPIPLRERAKQAQEALDQSKQEPADREKMKRNVNERDRKSVKYGCSLSTTSKYL